LVRRLDRLPQNRTPPCENLASEDGRRLESMIYTDQRSRSLHQLYTGKFLMTAFMKRHLTGLLLAGVLLNGLAAAQIQPAPQSRRNSSSASTAQTAQPQTNCRHDGTYVNPQGQSVKRPEDCSAAPQGATAQCRDGSYSFSTNRRGTCSHHRGVAKWL